MLEAQQNHMLTYKEFNAPFIYEALVLRKGKKAPIVIPVRDDHQFFLVTHTEASCPVAMSASDKKYHWDGERLWTAEIHGGHTPLTLSSMLELCEKRQHGSTPFLNLWQQLDHVHTMGAKHDVRMYALRTDKAMDDLPTKQDVLSSGEYSEWIDDNRDDVIALYEKKSNDIILIGNGVYGVSGEPRYVVMTYGMGGNHSSTNLTVTSVYNDRVDYEAYFNAFDLEKAMEYGDETASDRGDTESLPVKLCRETQEIKVFIPEAVKVVSQENWLLRKA